MRAFPNRAISEVRSLDSLSGSGLIGMVLIIVCGHFIEGRC